MANFNKVIIVGNLTRDPEKRYTRDGTAVVTFSVAINSFFKNKSTGDTQSKVDYIPVVVWGRQAENCSEYLSKGRGVLVEGALTSRSWETPQGDRRTRLEVIAQRVQFLFTSTKQTPDETKASNVEEEVIDEIVEDEVSEPPEGDVPF